MAEKTYGLTEAEVAILQKVIDRVLPSRLNQYSRPGSSETQLNTPEVYVAYPQESDGIPALVAGTGGDPDVPGSAKCDIYRILGGPQGSPTLVKVGNLFQTVYNLTKSILTQDWLTVTRDKFGSWLAQVGGSGTPSYVWRQVVEDIQIDTATKKLQKKMINLLVLDDEVYAPGTGTTDDPATSWTDVYTFVAVTGMTEFQVDGAAKKLQDKTKVFYAIEPAAESGWTDIHTGTTCP
jgi:hypothetical protein